VGLVRTDDVADLQRVTARARRPGCGKRRLRLRRGRTATVVVPPRAPTPQRRSSRLRGTTPPRRRPRAPRGFAPWKEDGGIRVLGRPAAGQASQPVEVLSGCSTAPGGAPASGACGSRRGLALLRRRRRSASTRIIHICGSLRPKSVEVAAPHPQAGQAGTRRVAGRMEAVGVAEGLPRPRRGPDQRIEDRCLLGGCCFDWGRGHRRRCSHRRRARDSW
jgi:hypothetical protein